jgi:hypothetical protein
MSDQTDITQRLRLHPDNKMKYAMQQDCLLAADCIDRLRAELAAAKAYLDRARQITSEQALDDGLWFVAETAPESYLQQELRRLTAAIEGDHHE